ncbi:unnamed protein product [Dovyalis caffra]|uniref:Response regulatory domain-containing protein n=1 Tax=Dovyalis caffra TaxID=77055 RepID=A0AAV1S4H8_9ROSI|nr:unnamed protein product [Dovyalis caffra]
MGEEEVEVAAGAFDSGANPIHVLVVDDSFVDRKIVEKLLKKISFKVTSVDSGKKAMEVLGFSEEKVDKTCINDQKIDLILTDYCMPEMNGYDLLMAVKEHNNMKSIPVVIMSSEYNPQRISRCLADGAEDFLSKPLQPEGLQKLKSYVRAIPPGPKTAAKRKVIPDFIPESNKVERRPFHSGVAVA